jgi:hypothetical protein
MKTVETATGTVNVELDAPQGRILLVQCPEHGRMAESMEQQAYVCTGTINFKGQPMLPCNKRLTRLEAEKVRQDGFDEIAATDRRQAREEAAMTEQRRQERFQDKRDARGE